MDLTGEAEAFGAEIVFPENEVPSVVGRLLNDEEAIDKLEIPALNKGRVPQYLKANMLAAKAITDRPVFAGCIGPYSLAGRLYDMSEIMMLIYINPEAANSLLKKCSDFILRYCMALKATGVNGVVMAEPAAGLLSDEDCTQYSSVFIKEIVEKSWLIVDSNKEMLQDLNFCDLWHTMLAKLGGRYAIWARYPQYPMLN